tara:strand:+ start:587 stop:865 length:279 start_codon:yes stop_codon:yes gene_type:complete
MPLINVHDLAQLLDRQGYYVDDEDGEVAISLNDTENVDNLLIILAVLGALQVKNKPEENQLGFFLPHWKCYDSMEAYCAQHPNDPACKTYDT